VFYQWLTAGCILHVRASNDSVAGINLTSANEMTWL